MFEAGEALKRVVDTLERLGIPYLLGGSGASSLHGLPRATLDLDLVAAVRPQHATALERELKQEFYVDADLIRDSLGVGRAFNLIHFASSCKFDIFPLSADPYHASEFDRRCEREVTLPNGEVLRIAVATPEDTILTKLAWYRKGGCVSERQWSDVLGVIAVQGNRLDREYMSRWAPDLGVEDLLERALAEAPSI
jgi:hypothetical protein